MSFGFCLVRQRYGFLYCSLHEVQHDKRSPNCTGCLGGNILQGSVVEVGVDRGGGAVSVLK